MKRGITYCICAIVSDRVNWDFNNYFTFWQIPVNEHTVPGIKPGGGSLMLWKCSFVANPEKVVTSKVKAAEYSINESERKTWLVSARERWVRISFPSRKTTLNIKCKATVDRNVIKTTHTVQSPNQRLWSWTLQNTVRTIDVCLLHDK